MNQAMVPITCEACDGIALTVPEQDYSNTLDGLACDCLSCGASGKVGLIGDDDSGIRLFPDPGLTPTRLADMFADLQRQVVEERFLQQGLGTEWFIGGQSTSTRVAQAAVHYAQWNNRTRNARHAKRLARWPSGEWQGMKVGG